MLIQTFQAHSEFYRVRLSHFEKYLSSYSFLHIYFKINLCNNGTYLMIKPLQ